MRFHGGPANPQTLGDPLRPLAIEQSVENLTLGGREPVGAGEPIEPRPGPDIRIGNEDHGRDRQIEVGAIRGAPADGHHAQ